MLSSATLRPLTPAQPITGAPAALSAVAGRRAAVAVVRAVRNYDSIPKREPFSLRRIILDEFHRQEKPLVQRTKDEITDYCMTVEGDECCSCWDAYFELNKLDQELPKEEIARMVKDSEGDVRYLINSIHHRSNLLHLAAAADSPRAPIGPGAAASHVDPGGLRGAGRGDARWVPLLLLPALRKKANVLVWELLSWYAFVDTKLIFLFVQVEDIHQYVETMKARYLSDRWHRGCE